MYAAKEAGKGRSAVFAPDMDSAIIGQLQMKAELARAVERGEFTVHYQPTVELATGRLAGVEALVRWQHPERGLVPPMDFIPLAEQTGLIVPIGRYVLREACRQMRAWQTGYPTDPPMTVSVNLSARELDEPGLVDSVRDALAETGLDPAHLVLEITESLLLVDLPATVGTLLELRLSACGSPSTTSAPATPRWPTSRTCRWTSSRSTSPSWTASASRRRTSPAADGARSSRSWSRRSASSGTRCACRLVAEGIEQREQVEHAARPGVPVRPGLLLRPAAAPPTRSAALLHRQADEPGWNLEPSDAAARPLAS